MLIACYSSLKLRGKINKQKVLLFEWQEFFFNHQLHSVLTTVKSLKESDQKITVSQFFNVI